MNRSAVVFDDWTYPQNTYRLMVQLTAEADGGYSAVCVNLPGVASQGETIGEALANVGEAAAGVLASYADHGEPVPWRDVSGYECPFGAEIRTLFLQLQKV